MRKVYSFLLVALVVCVGCEWRLKPGTASKNADAVVINRYDRIESHYLTTGDYAALQQMNIRYPMQTRTLLEDVLRIGKVNDPDINSKFLYFYQDSTLQSLISDVQKQYSDVSDLEQALGESFGRLKRALPKMEMPLVYTQIGSFDQSIIVGNNMLGISLDKYLGADYPFYVDNYSAQQRKMMVRSMIVPDCIGFYLLSIFPMPHDRELTQLERDMHMGKIQWVVNKMTEKRTFRNTYVAQVERYMKRNRHLTVEQLLRNNDYAAIK